MSTYFVGLLMLLSGVLIAIAGVSLLLQGLFQSHFSAPMEPRVVVVVLRLSVGISVMSHGILAIGLVQCAGATKGTCGSNAGIGAIAELLACSIFVFGIVTGGVLLGLVGLFFVLFAWIFSLSFFQSLALELDDIPSADRASLIKSVGAILVPTIVILATIQYGTAMNGSVNAAGTTSEGTLFLVILPWLSILSLVVLIFAYIRLIASLRESISQQLLAGLNAHPIKNPATKESETISFEEVKFQ